MSEGQASDAGGSAGSARHRVFVAFAGGGAKGLVHVGALRALEERNVRFLGFAGTSAGAIVAALAAAGFTAKDLVDPESEASVIDILKTHDGTIDGPIDLFGPGGWSIIANFRKLWLLSVWADRWVRLTWALLLPPLASAVALAGDMGLGWDSASWVLTAWLFTSLLCGAFALRLLFGMARLDTLRNALDRVLSEKLFGAGSRRTVVMRDFDGQARPLLKIVAANLTRRRLELFSHADSGDVPVADAVAASICLPFIFAPWRIGGEKFVDGGIVSNFPAWPFDEERTLDADAMTVGFEIGAPLADRARPTVRQRGALWPSLLLQTATFGAGALSTRAVGRAELITMRPAIGTMDFDIGSARTRAELADMTTAARAEIGLRLFDHPAVYEAACAQARDIISQSLETTVGVLIDSGRRPGRVRCSVAMPGRELKRSLQTRHGVGYGDDPDRDLVFPIASSLAGLAWTTGATVLELSPLENDLELQGPGDAALHRLLWREMAWSLRIPIFSTSGSPFLVVAVDGSAGLADSELTRNLFERIVDQIEADFAPVVRQFEV